MTLTVQGRSLGATELEQIRQLLQQHPEWSRWRLSQGLCELWAWRSPKGQLQDMAARALLLKLEQRGCLVLPPRRNRPPNRMRQKRFRPVTFIRDTPSAQESFLHEQSHFMLYL